MKRSRASLVLVVVGVAAILMIAGTATASNFAFKINTRIWQTTCSVCDNWISLPVNNEFVGQNLRALCDSNGDGIVDVTDSIQFVSQQGTAANSAQIDTLTTHSCTGPIFINNIPYQATRAVRLRNKATVVSDVDVIYVGSNVPGTVFTYYKSNLDGTNPGTCAGTSPTSRVCDNWVDLLYHTTYTNLRNACDSNGDGTVNASDEIQFVSVQGTAASPGSVDITTTHSCTGPVFINNLPVRIGRGMRVRTKAAAASAGDVAVAQPHF